MIILGFVDKHLSVDQKQLQSLVIAMDGIGVLNETVRLLGQRLEIELYANTQSHLNDALDKFKHPDRHQKHHYHSFFIKSQMRSAEANEFEGFAPVLSDMIQSLFIHHVVIYLGIRVAFSGHLLEDDSIWEKSRTAVIKQVNDLINAFTMTAVEGMAAAGQGYAAGFAELLKGTKLVHAPYSFRVTAPKDYIPPLFKSLVLGLNEKEKVAAEKVAAMTAVDQYYSQNSRNLLSIGVNPSLQYLPILSGHYCQLMEWMEVHDSVFIREQISNNYLPFLEAWMTQQLATIFAPDEVIKCEQVIGSLTLLPTSDRPSARICKWAIEFLNILDHGLGAIYHLSLVQRDIEMLMEAACGMLLEKIEGRMRELTGDDGSIKSGQFIQMAEIADLLSSHPIFNEQYDASLEEQISAKDRSLLRKELLSDPSILTQLCLIHHSLSTFMDLLSGQLAIKRFTKYTNIHWEEEKLMCSYLNVEPSEVFPLSEKFAHHFRSFSAALDKISMTALCIVRLELRVQCMYYVELAFREGQYHVDTIDEYTDGPDRHIIQLAKQLMSMNKAIVDSGLTEAKHHFCQSGLGTTIEHLMIANVRHIRGPLSTLDLGLKVLWENVLAMEQCLAVLLNSNERVILHKARTYFTLLSLSPSKFIQTVAESKDRHAFTLPEYQAALALHYKHSSEKGKEYENQLIRLKYLLEEK